MNDYIAEFYRLRALLPDMAEADALFAFESGLSASLAEKLRMQGVETVQAAIAMAARIGGLTQAPVKSSLNQMDIDDSAASLDDRIQRAVLNAMAARDTSGIGAKTQARMGYQQQRDERSEGRGGGPGGGRGGRSGGYQPRGTPVVPGVSEHVVRQRWDAQQCIRCGSSDHVARACPNATSASGRGN